MILLSVEGGESIYDSDQLDVAASEESGQCVVIEEAAIQPIDLEGPMMTDTDTANYPNNIIPEIPEKPSKKRHLEQHNDAVPSTSKVIEQETQETPQKKWAEWKPSSLKSKKHPALLLSASALSAGGGVGLVPTLVSEALGTEVDMVQDGSGAGSDGLIAPRRLPNPCLESPQRMDLHRELLFNQRIGKNVLNQKSELEKALSKHKEKQILNQVNSNRETPELERAIAERARRLEQAEQSAEEIEPGTNPTLQSVRARLRHAGPPAPSPAASAH